jgi:hypothetical protein
MAPLKALQKAAEAKAAEILSVGLKPESFSAAVKGRYRYIRGRRSRRA